MSNFNLEIPGSIRSTVKGNVDWYYGGGEEAWPTKTAALAGVPNSIRPGKTVGVVENGSIVEYIWQPGAVGDGDLIAKATAGSSFGTLQQVTDSGSSTTTSFGLISPANTSNFSVKSSVADTTDEVIINSTTTTLTKNIYDVSNTLIDSESTELSNSNIKHYSNLGSISLKFPGSDTLTSGDEILEVPYSTGTLARVEDIPSTQNGLTTSSGVTSLGGILTTNTSIDGSGSNGLTLTNLASFDLTNTGQNYFRSVLTNQGDSNSGAFNIRVGTGGFNIENSGDLNLTGNSRINMLGGTLYSSASNNIFTDSSSNNQGIVYASDYSANFVDESLVTKRYVDSVTGSIGSGDLDSVLVEGNTTDKNIIFQTTGASNQGLYFNAEGKNFGLEQETTESRGMFTTNLKLYKGIDTPVMTFFGDADNVFVHSELIVRSNSSVPLILVDTTNNTSSRFDLSELQSGNTRTYKFPDKNITVAGVDDLNPSYTLGWEEERRLGNVITIGKGVGKLRLTNGSNAIVGLDGVDFNNQSNFDSPFYYAEATIIMPDGTYRYLALDSNTDATNGTISNIYEDKPYGTSLGSTWDLATGDYEYYPYMIGKTLGDISLVSGNNIAYGNFGQAFGFSTKSKSFAETAIGMWATDYIGDISRHAPGDRMFIVGTGDTESNAFDAVTVLKSGVTGLGINNFEANNTGERLQVNGDIKSSSLIKSLASNTDIYNASNEAVITKGYFTANAATIDGSGKLISSQLPDLAITSVVIATENDLATFSSNSGNYTYEQGDVIIIDDGSGNLSHYMYKGGIKTDVNEYSLINSSQGVASTLQETLTAGNNFDSDIVGGNNSSIRMYGDAVKIDKSLVNFTQSTSVLDDSGLKVNNKGFSGTDIKTTSITGDGVNVADSTNPDLVSSIMRPNSVTSQIIYSGGSILSGTLYHDKAEIKDKISNNPDIYTSLGRGKVSVISNGNEYNLNLPYSDLYTASQNSVTHNITFPFKSGTVALEEDLSSTYLRKDIGGTVNGSINVNSTVLADRITVKDGRLSLAPNGSQSSDGNGKINYNLDKTFSFLHDSLSKGLTFDFNGVVGTKVVTIPDSNGTMAYQENVVAKTGGNFTGNVVLDPADSNTNIAGSLLTIKGVSEGVSTSTGQFVDVNRTASSTPGNLSTTFFGSVSRSVMNSTINDAGVAGANLVGRYAGTGGFNYSYGTINTAEYTGSGNGNFITGTVTRSTISGTSAGTIDYLRGEGITTTINNANATVNFMQASHQSLVFTEGNVGQASVVYLDVDPGSATITGDLAYIRAGNDTLPTINGNSYFIKSDSVLPSEFAGSIKSSNYVTGITFAQLPASPSAGDIATITDAGTVTYRGTAAGGGANVALVIYDGTDWIYS